MQQKIIVASANPVKIQCTSTGFKEVFPNISFTVEGHSLPSGVSDQPMSDEETYQGALNRAKNARSHHPNADFWVGIEGGVDNHDETLEAFAWVVILSESITGKSRTASFTVPPQVEKLVKEGIELGHADDMVFGRKNSKQQNGAVGLLTRDLIDRSSYYHHAVLLALVPFMNEELYIQNG